MKKTNPPTDLTVQGNDGENIPANVINENVYVTAKHVSVDTKKMIKTLNTSVSKSAVDSSTKKQKQPVQGDLTAVPSTSPDVVVNQPEKKKYPMPMKKTYPYPMPMKKTYPYPMPMQKKYPMPIKKTYPYPMPMKKKYTQVRSTVNETKLPGPNVNPKNEDTKNTDKKHTLLTAGPNLKAKPETDVADEKKVPVPNDPAENHTNPSKKKTTYDSSKALAATDNDKKEKKTTEPIAGPTLAVMKKQKDITTAESEDQKVKEKFKILDANFEYDGVKVEVKDHQVEKAPEWLARKEPTQKNSDSIINVKPHSNDSTVTTEETEEPMWCCCGIVGVSITATIFNLIYVIVACYYYYFASDFWDEEDEDLRDTIPIICICCAVITAILSMCMLVFNFIAACKSSSSLCYTSGIGNIVSNNVFLLIDGIVCLILVHTYQVLNLKQKNDLNITEFMIVLVIWNVTMITSAWIYVRVGLLQLEVAAQLHKKEEAETKEQCENPSLNN